MAAINKELMALISARDFETACFIYDRGMQFIRRWGRSFTSLITRPSLRTPSAMRPPRFEAVSRAQDMPIAVADASSRFRDGVP